MSKFVIREDDTKFDEQPIACLNTEIESKDLLDSQDCVISIRYNEIDLGKSGYGFDQPFVGDEANMYFERMNVFSKMTINKIIDEGLNSWHFHRTDIKGNVKKAFDKIDPKIAKANPLIYHFALNPDCQTEANREAGTRNPRIYFMVGYNGTIHPIFFDPYHELNPMVK